MSIDEKRERIILAIILVYFVFLLIGPFLIPEKETFKMKIIAMDSKTLHDLNYIRLYYHKARLVSIDGKMYYVPQGRLEFIGMTGQFEFTKGQVYEIRYKPIRRNVRGINHLVEVTELIT